jgi:membrane protease YdiL (CAAX protease family)
VVLGLHFVVKVLDGALDPRPGAMIGPHIHPLILGLALGWLSIRRRFDWRQLWGVRPHFTSVRFGLLVGVALFAVESAVVLVVRVFTDYSDRVTPLWAVAPALAEFPWYFPLGFVLVGPFVEETIYRSIAFRGWARRLRPVGAALLISAWFALNHELSVFSLTTTFAASLAYIWVQLRTSSMWPAIASHAVANLLVLLLGVVEFELIGRGVVID